MCLFSLCLHTLFHRVMFLGTIKHKDNSVINYGKFPNNDYYLFFCPSLIFIHIIIGFSYLLLNVSTYHFSLLYLQINIKIYFVHIMQISYGVRGRDVGLPSTFRSRNNTKIPHCRNNFKIPHCRNNFKILHCRNNSKIKYQNRRR